MENSKGIFYYLDNIWSIKGEFWVASQQTLIMVIIATVIAVLFGLAIGICLHLTNPNQLWKNKWANKTLGTLVDFLRAFPFVILMVAISPFSESLINVLSGNNPTVFFGTYTASVALSVAAIPYFARLVEQNLREIPKGIIEAAQAMGASNTTIIFRVLITEARAGIVSSTTVLIISILSYSAAAGMIGGGGLGDLAIRYGYNRYQTDIMIAVVVLLSIIVIMIQALGNFITRKIDKR